MVPEVVEVEVPDDAVLGAISRDVRGPEVVTVPLGWAVGEGSRRTPGPPHDERA